MTTQCTICPRHCPVDRTNNELGFCGLPAGIFVSSRIIHWGEEPCFTGTKGVGNFFFTSCNLTCVYCQNYQISQMQKGNQKISTEEFVESALAFQSQGVHFVGLVTPSHQSPWIRKALKQAINQGFNTPIIYNSSGYDSIEELKKWEGLIHVYLPDLKYATNSNGKKYSHVNNYETVSKNVILEMYRQVGDIQIHPDTGIAKKGLWVRHLVLPNQIAGTWESLCFLSLEVSKKIGLSLMAQYTPMNQTHQFPELNRKIQQTEYNDALRMAVDLGFTEIQTQVLSDASFYGIPNFDSDNPFQVYS